MPLINHRCAGPVDRLLLLLIHPLGADLSFWDDCIACWGEGVATLAVDLRAAGRSPRGVEPPGIDDHVQDLRDLLTALGRPEVVVIGCALGSAVAVALAARDPDRVKALVMANPEIRLSQTARSHLRERAAIVRAEGCAVLLPQAVDAIFAGLPRDDRYRRALVQFAALEPEAHADSILGFLDTDVGPLLAEVRQPVLLVPARLDAFSSEADVADIARLCPAARVTWLEGAGHFGPFQAPGRFADIVTDFLGGLLPISRAHQPAKE